MSARDFAFLHGGGQGGWVWAETIAALVRQTDGTAGHMLALDAPGCGAKRDRDTTQLAMANVARELTEEIEAAGLRDVTLVGHSQAGQALPIMARLRPGLFRRLIYVTCSAPRPGQSVMEMIGGGIRGVVPDEVGWPVDPATTDPRTRFRLMFCNDMDDAQAKAFLARTGRDNWPERTYGERDWSYRELGVVPATFVLCLRDMSLPLDWQHVFADRLGAAHRISIDAGHQVMNTRPHALAEILRIEAEKGRMRT
jgi:pimeloyl-ACP methyl ester carboxylesterase